MFTIQMKSQGTVLQSSTFATDFHPWYLLGFLGGFLGILGQFMHRIYLINPLRHVYIAPQNAPSSLHFVLAMDFSFIYVEYIHFKCLQAFLKLHFFLDFNFHKKDPAYKAVLSAQGVKVMDL